MECTGLKDGSNGIGVVSVVVGKGALSATGVSQTLVCRVDTEQVD